MGALVQILAQYHLGGSCRGLWGCQLDDRLPMDAFAKGFPVVHALHAGQSTQAFTVACDGWFRRDVPVRSYSVAAFATHCALPRATAFVGRHLDLHAADGIRRRGLLLFLVATDSNSEQLVRGLHIGGDCPLRAVLALSNRRSAPLVEHPRRDGGRKLFLSRADSLARSVDRHDSLGGLHFYRSPHI